MAANWVHCAATETFALTRASRDCPLYPVLTCCFKTILLFSITCFPTVVAHLQHYCCTDDNAPPQASRTKADVMLRALMINLAGGQARLCCCGFVFYSRRHTTTTTHRPRGTSSYRNFYMDSLSIFPSELISAHSSRNISSSCYVFSGKRPILVPSCLIVPRCFCLNVNLDIR